jgi:hypothetical protein
MTFSHATAAFLAILREHARTVRSPTVREGTSAVDSIDEPLI